MKVPAPERYAVHKLIVSRRRPAGAAKREKDIQQAAALLELLAQKRPYELKAAWKEAYQSGKRWSRLLGEGLGQLPAAIRDLALKVVDERRGKLTGLNLTFNDPPPKHDFSRDVVTFVGEALGSPVTCAISREALDDNFGAAGTSGRTIEERLETFRKNRSVIEDLARHKYLFWPVEEIGAVLIRTQDVPKLLKEIGR